MRLNLGCGHVPLRGYVNVDSHADEANIRGDIRHLEFEDVEEVVMQHTLEHIPHGQVVWTLRRIREWMREGAKITVEVPDMERIGPGQNPNWIVYTYGSQEHDGELHRSGFTEQLLQNALVSAGFTVESSRVFDSENPVRPGMPCVEVVAVA